MMAPPPFVEPPTPAPPSEPASPTVKQGPVDGKGTFTTRLAQSIYSLAPPPTTDPASTDRIKITAVASTHTSKPRLPAADILVHVGDLSLRATQAEVQDQLSWLAAAPGFTHKFLVATARDADAIRTARLLEQSIGVGSGYALNFGDVRYLAGASATVQVRGRSVTVCFPPSEPGIETIKTQVYLLDPLQIYGMPPPPTNAAAASAATLATMSAFDDNTSCCSTSSADTDKNDGIPTPDNPVDIILSPVPPSGLILPPSTTVANNRASVTSTTSLPFIVPIPEGASDTPSGRAVRRTLYALRPAALICGGTPTTTLSTTANPDGFLRLLLDDVTAAHEAVHQRGGVGSLARLGWAVASARMRGRAGRECLVVNAAPSRGVGGLRGGGRRGRGAVLLEI